MRSGLHVDLAQSAVAATSLAIAARFTARSSPPNARRRFSPAARRPRRPARCLCARTSLRRHARSLPQPSARHRQDRCRRSPPTRRARQTPARPLVLCRAATGHERHIARLSTHCRPSLLCATVHPSWRASRVSLVRQRARAAPPRREGVAWPCQAPNRTMRLPSTRIVYDDAVRRRRPRDRSPEGGVLIPGWVTLQTAVDLSNGERVWQQRISSIRNDNEIAGG
jgi:hypothetical protein